VIDYPVKLSKNVFSFHFVTSCKHHAVDILINALGRGKPLPTSSKKKGKDWKGIRTKGELLDASFRSYQRGGSFVSLSLLCFFVLPASEYALGCGPAELDCVSLL
jgi:hypothetical protein